MARKKKAAPPEKLTPTLPVLTPRRLMFDITPSGLVREPFRRTHAGAWRKLRRDRIKTGNLACDLCGAHEDIPEHLHLHEVYGYPNRETVGLDATQFLCRLCHDTIHYDRTRTFAQQPWRNECMAHYCKLNGVTAETFEADRRAAISATFDVNRFYGSANPGHAVRPVLDYGPYSEMAKASEKRKEEFKKSGREPFDRGREGGEEAWDYTPGGTPIGYGFRDGIFTVFDPYSGDS
jgi:hypothetical protein